MRMAGRTRDGLAKGLNVLEDGTLGVAPASTLLLDELASADGREINPGLNWISKRFYIGSLDQVEVNISVNNTMRYDVFVEEYYANAAGKYKSLGIKNIGDALNSGNKTFKASVSAPYVRIEVRALASNTEKIGVGIYAIAKSKTQTDFNIINTPNVNAINSKKILMQEMNSTDGIVLEANGGTRTTPLLDMAGYNRLNFVISTVVPVQYKVSVLEFRSNGSSEALNATIELDGIFTNSRQFKVDVSSKFVKIKIELLSSENRRMGIYAYAENANPTIDTSGSLVTTLDKKSIDAIGNQISLLQLQTSSSQDYKVPKLKNVMIKDTEIRWVHTFKDGKFYGSQDNKIYTSTDGENWELLKTIPTGAGNSIQKIIISDTNRFVVCMGNGEIWVSDEAGNFGSASSYRTGSFTHYYGSTQYANVIGLTTYERAGLEDTKKHEAWLSTDNGATFKKIFDKTNLTALQPNNDGRMHLHDIEYDPYSGVIYIWNGDFGNASLNYSTDMGNTWKMVDATKQNGNITQLIATKKGLALGADTYGGGVEYLNINRSKLIFPEIKDSDVEVNYWKFNDGLSSDNIGSRYVAYKKYVNRDEDIYLLPFKPEYLNEGDFKTTFIGYSPDGVNWSVLWRGFESGHLLGMDDIVYGNGKVIGAYNFVANESTTTRKLFTADIAF